MQKLKVLIVEDELIIAESLKIMLEGMDYEVAAIFTSGTETLKKFKPGFADIVMMDIQLGGNTNGVDTSIALKKMSDAPVIFITDITDDLVRKKAINESNAVYYINKPFNKLSIGAAIDLALKSLNKDLPENVVNEHAFLLNDCIFVKNTLGFKKVMVADILFLQADGSYCDLHLKDNKITYCENLSFFEEKFSFAKQMVRIHRSYIVNINFVSRVHENRVWIGETEIPIGKNYRNALKDFFRFI